MRASLVGREIFRTEADILGDIRDKLRRTSLAI